MRRGTLSVAVAVIARLCFRHSPANAEFPNGAWRRWGEWVLKGRRWNVG